MCTKVTLERWLVETLLQLKPEKVRMLVFWYSSLIRVSMHGFSLTKLTNRKLTLVSKPASCMYIAKWLFMKTGT